MADRQSSSSFPWIWILVPVIGNALRGLREIARPRPDSDFLAVLVGVLIVLAILGLLKVAFSSIRRGPRAAQDHHPAQLDPLWDDQLDRYPR
jgi:hypothetical protein